MMTTMHSKKIAFMVSLFNIFRRFCRWSRSKFAYVWLIREMSLRRIE